MNKLRLDNIRILDFTWAWAGPYGTLLLAFMGAEVIKVESRMRLDHSRIRSLAAGPNYGGPNQAGPFNDLNLNKKSITLNLGDPRGVELARKLAAISDVVVNNFRPGVMDRWGMGYEDLKKIKPDIIMLSSSACGATGPEKDYIGYAPSFCALGGLSHLTGYADGKPTTLGGRIDTSSGTACALAILAALVYRRRTGRGQYIDFSSREAVSALLGETLMDYILNGRIAQRRGNRDDKMAPHNAYRCRGYDSWISLAVKSEAEWQALLQVMGRPELAQDPRFSQPEHRHRHQEALDEIISVWTMNFDSQELMFKLQKAGVAAAPAFNAQELAENDHMKARRVFVKVKPPEMNERVVVAPPWKTGALEDEQIKTPAPLLGEHNDYVYGRLLGLSTAEIEALAKEEIIH